jgi:hypothetical protein
MNIVSRSEWGARPPKSVTGINRSEGIFVHYRGPGGAPTTPAGEAAALRQDQAFHMDTRRWQDIAYPWAVGQTGRIYQLRGWGVQGGHTEGWNSRSHAVLWIGGQDATPSPAALTSIQTVCAEHRRRYGGWVRPHNSAAATSCPGVTLTRLTLEGFFSTTQAPPPIKEEPHVRPDQLISYKGGIYLVVGATQRAHHIKSPDDVTWIQAAYFAAKSPLVDNRSNKEAARAIDSGAVVIG